MLRNLQVARSGMIAQQRRVEITANNLANASTTGFRRLLLAQSTPSAGPTPLDPTGGPAQATLPIDLTSRIDTTQGPLSATGNPLHVAIQGEGYFVVATPEGDRFTRDGAFRQDPEGNLVTSSGLQVQGDGGPLPIPLGEVQVAGDGRIIVGNQEVGTIRLVNFDDPSALQPAGEGLLKTTREVPPQDIDVPDRRLLVGHLEGSNANPITELVNLITAQRLFESNQRVLTTTDESLRRTVNDIPGLR